jgi:hypothetical protein
MPTKEVAFCATISLCVALSAPIHAATISLQSSSNGYFSGSLAGIPQDPSDAGETLGPIIIHDPGPVFGPIIIHDPGPVFGPITIHDLGPVLGPLIIHDPGLILGSVIVHDPGPAGDPEINDDRHIAEQLAFADGAAAAPVVLVPPFTNDAGLVTTPLPTALPLFAVGVGMLGIMGLLRRRRSTMVRAQYCK